MINKYDLAALLTLAGLDDGETRKLSAKQQRELFGAVVVGRKDISFDPANQGTVRIGWWADPTAYDWTDKTYEQFATMIDAAVEAAQPVTVRGLARKYECEYRFSRGIDATAQGREKAALDLWLELEEIAALPSKAAQKRQLKRMIDCYETDEGRVETSDPVQIATRTALRDACAELRRIKTFTVV